MTLADTSAWVAFTRDSDAAFADQFERLLESREIAFTDPVAMELLAGARDRTHLAQLRSFLAGASIVPVEGLADWEQASAIYRRCRASGITLRSQLDCLIAAVAIRESLPVLHADRDFDEIAKHTSLLVAPV